MELWQEDIALRAERAAHACFLCGQYGHYPNECPRKLRPQVSAHEERAPSIYVFIFGLVLGLVVGMCLMRGFA